VAVPVFGGKAGTARVGFSNQGVRRVFLDLTYQVLLTTAIVFVMSLLAATFLTFVLTRPILDLVEASRAIGRGDFSLRVRRWANDEIGELAEAFNQMAVDLERADEVRRERELLRSQLFERVILAQEEERRRISRELHDSTSQNLTSLMVGLRTLENSCDTPQVHCQTQELRGIVGQVLEDVHVLAVQPEGYIMLNRADAERLGIQPGDSVRLSSASNPEGVWDVKGRRTVPMVGKAHIVEGLRPGVVAFPLGYGHWASGSSDISIDDQVVKGDPRRAAPMHGNAAMRVDPHLGNVTLSDLAGGSAVFYDTKVKVSKA
jgi:HAMP domain-containing protein